MRNQVSEDPEDTNWHIAIWQEHKLFVSHSYFQHFTWKFLTG